MISFSRKNIVRKERQLYQGYRVLNRDFDRRNLDAVIRILTWSARNMKSPKMMHFVLEITDFDIFQTNRFIQRFKEKFSSHMRQRNNIRNKQMPEDKRIKLPELQLIYSIETKWLNAYLYHHLHLMVIVDTNYNDYGHREIMIAVNRTLSNINGLDSLYFDSIKAIFFKENIQLNNGFLKYRNENSSVKIGTFKQLFWHDLKTELPDAVCRASYLCKLDQKELLPDKFKRGNSFGHTRPKIDIPKQKNKLPSSLEIGTQLKFQ